MRIKRFFWLLGVWSMGVSGIGAQGGNGGRVPAFQLTRSDIELQRPARPGTPFNRSGRRCALLADESGRFEAWAYPLKLVQNVELSFLVGESTRPIRAAEIVRRIAVSPEATVLTYT